jgi:hypothetical protein
VEVAITFTIMHSEGTFRVADNIGRSAAPCWYARRSVDLRFRPRCPCSAEFRCRDRHRQCTPRLSRYGGDHGVMTPHSWRTAE